MVKITKIAEKPSPHTQAAETLLNQLLQDLPLKCLDSVDRGEGVFTLIAAAMALGRHVTEDCEGFPGERGLLGWQLDLVEVLLTSSGLRGTRRLPLCWRCASALDCVIPKEQFQPP